MSSTDVIGEFKQNGAHTARARNRIQRHLSRRPRPQVRNDRKDDYHDYCKPKLADLLSALALDVEYVRASGSYVYSVKNTPDGPEETSVLDLVGGYGASLFGHNNPELRAHLIDALHDDRPAFVQGAIRSDAGTLARLLNRHLGSTGKYFCNFANSGAEAVEAAVKHAYKVRLDAIVEMYEAVTRDLNDLYHDLDQQAAPPELPDRFESLSKFRDAIDEHNLAELERFRNSPVVGAVKGAFHGKTTTALKLTFNKTYRESFEGLSSLRTVFFERDRPERVRDIVNEHQVSFLRTRVADGRVVVEQTSTTMVIAVVMEVILGEGGVKPIPREALRQLAELHGELGVPYIIDEIQTGCGRTGALFAYKQTPLDAIEPEYLLLGKALGGGLVKVSAALIHESVYDPDFGLLHSSTFSDDELSCSVAAHVIEMLTRDESRLLREVMRKGNYLKARLDALQTEYPRIIKEVRGRGLMVGLEFAELTDSGPLFGYASRKGFISLLIASYLLHHHNMRVTAPLATMFKGNPGKKRESVIRIQPPVTITEAEIDRFIEALEDVIRVITANDEFCLLAHLIGEEPTTPHPVVSSQASGTEQRTQFDARAGFVVHITRMDYLLDYYLPSFRHHRYDCARLMSWWNRLSRFLEPETVSTAYVESDGFVVEVNVIVVPCTAEAMIRAYAVGRHANANRFDRLLLKEVRDKIRDATIVARDLGDERIPTSVVGLGAYTSIVTENGLTMNDYEMPVTTGNAYTTALTLQGIVTAAEEIGRDLDTSTVAVVGAAGNIGSGLSELLCFHAERLLLIGRGGPESDDRLERLTERCLAAVANEVGSQLASGAAPADVKLGGLARVTYEDLLRPRLESSTVMHDEIDCVVDALKAGESLPEDTGRRLSRAVASRRPPDQEPLVALADMTALQNCDVVAIATNSPEARLIGPDQVSDGAIVACASVPSNLSDKFRDGSANIYAFDAGIGQLPEGGTINLVGMPRDGKAFGCLCETLLVAFEGTNRSFTKGVVTRNQVRRTIEMADDYGFAVDVPMRSAVSPLRTT